VSQPWLRAARRYTKRIPRCRRSTSAASDANLVPDANLHTVPYASASCLRVASSSTDSATALTAAVPVVASSTTSCRAEVASRPSQRARVRLGTGRNPHARPGGESPADVADVADTATVEVGRVVRTTSATGAWVGNAGVAGDIVAVSTRRQTHHRCRARNAGRTLQVAPQLGLAQMNRTTRSAASIASPSGLRSG
jgi:hypothetical protein